MKMKIQLSSRMFPDTIKSLKTEREKRDLEEIKPDKLGKLKEELKKLNKILNIGRKRAKSESTLKPIFPEAIKYNLKNNLHREINQLF